MTNREPQPTSPPPPPRFQFTLRTLLLLFVVLGSSLALFGAWGIVVFGLVVGLAIYLREAEFLWPSLMLLIFLLVLLFAVLALVMPQANQAREASCRTTCANNLYEIASALHRYHRTHGCFPPAYVADKDGKAMHSWRVLLLPYLDQRPLYHMFVLAEPWDGPKNKRWSATPLRTFACPDDGVDLVQNPLQTSYLAVVGANTAWAGEKPTKLADFGKDASTTILLVEVTHSGIAWAEPKDILLEAIGGDSQSGPPALASKHGRREGFFVTYDYGACIHVAMVDGHVQLLRLGNRSPEELRKLLQIGGCKEESLGSPEVRPNWPNIAALAVWLLSVGTLLVGAVRSRKARVGRRSEA